MGNGNQQLLLESWMSQEATMSKQKKGSMYSRNWKHLLKTESDEDQTIELLNDEDEAKIVHIKSWRCNKWWRKNHRTRRNKIRIKNEIRKNINKTKSIKRSWNVLEEGESNDIELYEQYDS